MIVTLAFHLPFAAWSWSNKKESRREHSSRFGERRRHRYPGLTARRCCLARCCQEGVPGTSAEAVYSREYQLQRHPGKKFNTTASCRWVVCQVFKAYIYGRSTDVICQNQDWYRKSFTENCPVERVNCSTCISGGNAITREEELLKLKNCLSFSI